MSEAKDLQVIKSPEVFELDGLVLIAAASRVGDAYQMDYFKEYKHGSPKPSESDRRLVWEKAEKDFPQFAEAISVLGASIPGSQHAREISQGALSVFGQVVNPVTRELLINLLLIRVGAHTSPFKARELLVSQGPENEKKMMNEISPGDPDGLRGISPADVAEAYLDGRLPISNAPSDPSSL